MQIQFESQHPFHCHHHCNCLQFLFSLRSRASDISRKKKQNFAGFLGANSRKKSADFAEFSREKSQNSQKNRPISRDFSGKKSNLEGFSGENSQKNWLISWEISGGIFAKKQSVKNIRFRWIFCRQISLKQISFASICPALFNVFFNRDNHLLFQQQFAPDMSKC